MRFESVRAIYDYGIKNGKMCFITGDYGHTKTEEFRSDFGDRYFNGGMSEQNIIGMSAGMAISGLRVATYSIVPFITLRCFEQIKIDVCEQNADVLIIGGGGGLAYGGAGATHYSIEEIAALSALPRMKIVSPADPREAYELTSQLLELGGPAYIRIGSGREDDLPVDKYNVKLGKAAVLKEGGDAVIFSYGTIIKEALKTSEMLKERGIDLGVVNVHTIKPLDKDTIVKESRGKRAVFVLEEHNVIGGLGSMISSLLLEGGLTPEIFKIFGVEDTWPKKIGSQKYLREELGISGNKISQKIDNLLR